MGVEVYGFYFMFILEMGEIWDEGKRGRSFVKVEKWVTTSDFRGYLRPNVCFGGASKKAKMSEKAICITFFEIMRVW